MKKYIFNSGKPILFIEGTILFLILSFVFYVVGYYNFCYLEQWNTFIFSKEAYSDILFQPGGAIRILSNFIVQLFVHPLSGIFISAFILTCLALALSCILYKWSRNRASFPISLFPVASLIFLHYNVNYSYSGTLAILLMLAFLSLYLSINKFSYRFVYSVISLLLIYQLAGPIASLYGTILIIMELSNLKWKSLFILILPLILLTTVYFSLKQGVVGEWKQLLLPDGYFTLRLHPGNIIYMPWIIISSVFVLCGISKLFELKKKWMVISANVIVFVAAAVFTQTGIKKYVDGKSEIFKELNYYASNSQWDKIIERCGNIPINNLLYQNYLNIALAEKGMLADNLFKEPCYDIQTIYVVSNKTPYISALLSDIYFSMGHISLSQRTAFEANEGVGNFSPRMLKRLVQTNIIYGAYGVADKYLDLLDNTMFYKEWAESYRKFLWNDAAVEADPILGAKRKCLFPDNRFAGINGLDDDLKQIAIQNPSHKITVQYLGSLYLLFKDLPRFMQTMEQFYGTKALPSPLPLYFQEAVVAYASGDDKILKKYQIDDAVVKRYESFKKEPLQQPKSLWHFLKFRI